MKLGEVAIGDAAGAILAHTLRAGPRVLKKGRVLDEADVAALAAAGYARVTCARLDDGDVGEDAAAAAVAAAVAAAGVRVDPAATGRVNLFAEAAGVVVVDGAAVDRVNAVDEAVTLATLARHAPVAAGTMVATVKIIPFAVPGGVVRAAAATGTGAVGVAAWCGRRAGLILTRLPGVPEQLLDRAARAQRERVARCGGELVGERRVDHDAGAVAAAARELRAAGADLVLALGASAVIDRADVIPRAVEEAGGRVVRLGMPVDPGNLLVVGRLDGADLIGVPGCARSLRRSGFDVVLERLCAGLPVDSELVAGLGVGGLLDEIEARPRPRAAASGEAEAGAAGAAPGVDDRPRVAAVVLAAGRGTRMRAGGVPGSKLLAELDGRPLVRWVVDAALASRARPIVVVTGHQADAVRAALAGCDVVVVDNPAHADGMSTSLRVGLAAVERASGGAAAVDGALICLGDMPRVTAANLDALIDAFAPAADASIVVPTHQRKRGNPVLWARRYFAEMAALDGDVGARGLIERHADQVRTVAVEDAGVLVDVDTPAALAALGGGGGGAKGPGRPR